MINSEWKIDSRMWLSKMSGKDRIRSTHHETGIREASTERAWNTKRYMKQSQSSAFILQECRRIPLPAEYFFTIIFAELRMENLPCQNQKEHAKIHAHVWRIWIL